MCERFRRECVRVRREIQLLLSQMIVRGRELEIKLVLQPTTFDLSRKKVEVAYLGNSELGWKKPQPKGFKTQVLNPEGGVGF